MNNKGFAITSFLYGILIAFLLIFSILLINVINTRLSLNNIKTDVKEEFEDNSYTQNQFYANIIVENQKVQMRVNKSIDLLDGVHLEKYDGTILNNEITYTSSPTFNNSKEGIYVINYSTTINGVEYVNHKIVEVLPKLEFAYDDGAVVYYDVKTGNPCLESDYHADNSLTGYNGITTSTANQTSCMKFYAFGDTKEAENVSLLLDHNTTARAAWKNTTSNTTGPATTTNYVLAYLNSATSSWVGTETPDNYTIAQTSAGNYTINYSGYKARLMTAAEVAAITGSSFNERTSRYTAYFFFTSNSTTSSTTCRSGNTSGCKHTWLYDRTSTSCTTYGCLNNASTTTSGFWTATSTYGNTQYAWYVKNDGSLYYATINSSTTAGVRPVIEVNKEKLVDNINTGGNTGENTGGDSSGGDDCELVSFEFTYTGDYKLIDDGNNSYRIRFLSDGQFTVNKNITIDAFLVGGGGGGGVGDIYEGSSYGGGGGGGGYTKTVSNINITSGTPYTITIGKGGGSGQDGKTTYAFNQNVTGGKAGDGMFGGNGGSGGGVGGYGEYFDAGNGGNNGNDGDTGELGEYGVSAASGQRTTTCEFGERSGTSCKYTDNGYNGLYSGGGGGASGWSSDYVSSNYGRGGTGGGANGVASGNVKAAPNNTGGGGGGAPYSGTGGTGGSGIVVIRYTKPEDSC